ncbi:ABC transporter ATP-binding protein [Salaquimonas pukyongi]|uniref:ABC transporter ATP-binding protein n=1 Tax=Salaquimonas pukyongi TaxID=2712698 RepID=UPI00096BB901|nr:ABC transporter ATP-binding protein [Salaquimonas pukyongi]
MTLLTLEGVTAYYGSSQALFNVNLEVGAGEVVALMGRNGMGKSTTVKSVFGLLPAAGVVRFSGHDLLPMPPHRVARLGIGLVPEGRRCFGNLSVEKNLTAAARPGDWSLKSVTDLFPRLGERLPQIASSLSGGEQQMLAIARALMTNPKLLVLDEATEGLAPLVRKEIWKVIARLKQESDMAILIIDKSVRELRQIADRAVVLQRGETVWSGPVAALTPELTERYLGV